MKKPVRKIPTTKAERQAFYKEAEATRKEARTLINAVKSKAANKKDN